MNFNEVRTLKQRISDYCGIVDELMKMSEVKSAHKKRLLRSKIRLALGTAFIDGKAQAVLRLIQATTRKKR